MPHTANSATGEAGATPDYPMLMIQAEIESGKATVRSLGALYMVAMATRAVRNGAFGDFSDINRTISGYRCPAGTEAEKAMSLEPVKKIAWTLYEKVCLLRDVENAR